MDLPPQSPPQNQPSEPVAKKGFSLGFQIIIATIIVLLIPFAQYFIFSSLFHPKSGAIALGFLVASIFQLTASFFGVIISIILIFIANNLKNNPNISKNISITYLSAPLILLISIIPFFRFLLSFVFLYPLLIYDYFFIKIYLQSKKSIKQEQIKNGVFVQKPTVSKFQLLLKITFINLKAMLFILGITIMIYVPLLILTSFLAVLLIPAIIIGLIGLVFLVYCVYSAIIIFSKIETTADFILKIKIILFAAIAIGWVTFPLADAPFCDGCGGGNIFTSLSFIYIFLIPYTLIMLKYGFPKLKSFEEELKINNDEKTQPVSPNSILNPERLPPVNN